MGTSRSLFNRGNAFCCSIQRLAMLVIACFALMGVSHQAHAQCPANNNDCCSPGAPSSPGCNQPACCTAICAADPFCCATDWDNLCADAAANNPLCGCNDECAERILITEGQFFYSTVGATTDGPLACDVLENDIWYNYTPSADGVVTITTCPPPGVSSCCLNSGGPGCDDAACEACVCAIDDFCCGVAWDGICASIALTDCAASCPCGDLTNYDSTIAAYLGCECPADPFSELACNDDFCGLQSLISFCVNAGECYKIQVGGFLGSAGTGTLTVTLDSTDTDGDGVPDCKDICPGGDDGVDSDGDGIPDFCDPCPLDPDNDVDGDGVCGDVDNCPDVFNPGQEDNEGDGLGDACDPDDDNDGIDDVDKPGSGTDPNDPDSDDDGQLDGDDPCPLDPLDLCLCGGPDAGDCCVANGTPYCNNAACCQAICAADPFCCETEWDGVCADAAEAEPLCDCAGPCDKSNPNDCCVANGTPGCNQPDCCEAVCANDSFCCDVAWDSLCADAALNEPLCDCANSTLALELGAGSDCVQPGEKIEVLVTMSNLGDFQAAGFQAFITFDDTSLEFNPAGSFLTDEPFGATVLPITLVGGNQLHMASGICQDPVLQGCDEIQPPTSEDALLAVLSFVALTENCEGKTLSFKDGPGGTPSSISNLLGQPPDDLRLTNSPPIIIDGKAPEITCPDDIRVQCKDELPPPDPGSVFAIDNCGQGTPGSNCCAPTGAPGCNDPVCQAAVCAIDSFCCDVAWDSICAGEALADPACNGCQGGPQEPGISVTVIHLGDEPSGGSNCCVANGGVGCDNPSCTAAVCAADSFCCDVAWDSICADAASNVLCIALCSEAGNCGGFIVRTYQAIDCAGNTTECKQFIEISDTSPPEITCPPDTIVEWGLESPDNTGFPVVTDNCGDDLVPTFEDSILKTGSCPVVVIITRTWTVIDDCGNVASCTQTIQATDTTAPVVTCPPNTKIECDQDPSPLVTGTPTIVDNCDPNPAISFVDFTVPGSCPNASIINRAWVAIDSCGNRGVCFQVIEVNDTTPPTLIGCPADIEVQCGLPIPPPALVSGVDNCDSDVNVTVVETPGVPGDCPQEFTFSRIWTAIDSCGNAASCTQNISVVDTVGPVITCPDDSTIEWVQPFQPPDPSVTGLATAEDACGGSTVDFTDGPLQGPGPDPCAPFFFIRTWTATDECGNASSCDQIITIVDTTPPVLTCGDDVSVNADAGGCDALVALTPPTATDNCDPDVEFTAVRDDGLTLADPYTGTVIVTWTGTDDCGNSSTCDQLVTVSEFNELVVDVQLQGVSAGPFTRCITFELHNCTTLDSETAEVVTSFSGGLASDVLLLVPCGDWDCITARDRLHTLRRTIDPLTITGTQYTASFTGGDQLIGGNLNDPSNVIDIFDFGLFASEFNNNYGTADTNCSTAAPHADISGNGVVFVEDFTFITTNFLATSEPNCCGQPGIAGDETPVISISVADLNSMGLGHLAAGDLNGDGWLDPLDMQAFADGIWPTDDQVRTVTFTGQDGASWFDAANWSDGELPDAKTDVTLTVLVTLDGGAAEARNVSIVDGGAMTMLAASLSAQNVLVNSGAMLVLDDPAAMLAAESVFIAEGGALAWNAGALVADLVNHGIVDIGAPVAHVVLDGNFMQHATGMLMITVGDAVTHDSFQVAGTATLGGTLEVHIAEGFIPANGVKADVLVANLVIGEFATVLPPALPDGLFQHLAIGETNVNVLFSDQPLLPIDLNGDGIIGAADLAELLAQWGVCVPVCTADFNADGVVNSADLAEILAAWTS